MYLVLEQQTAMQVKMAPIIMFIPFALEKF